MCLFQKSMYLERITNEPQDIIQEKYKEWAGQV